MLITFEGPEGAGKTTAIRALDEKLRQNGSEVVMTREPGSGSLGLRIRELLLHGDELDARTTLLLFLADRANHVATVIQPALEARKIVLCDRFTDSTVAYQGYAQGLNLEFVRRANEFATGGLKPDITILFDLDPQIGLDRLQTKDRMDRQPIEFHRAVRDGFLQEARMEPRRWIIMDASHTKEEVLESVLAVVMERLN
jgi:dTMP kinase